MTRRKSQSIHSRHSSRSSRSRQLTPARRRSRRQHHIRQKSKHVARVTSEMGITELQRVAKTIGIPFGGLTKTKLVRRINKYI